MVKKSIFQFGAGAFAMAFVAAAFGGSMAAQQPAGAPPAPGARGGGRGGGVAPALFSAADANKDGALTRPELTSLVGRWYSEADKEKAGSVTPEQLTDVLTAAFPAPAGPPRGGRAAVQPCALQGSHTACPDDIAKMMAALPDKAYAKPAKPRKLLIYAVDNDSPSKGFVHSSIALQAATMKAIGDKLGTWSSTISYDPADFTTDNLKQYDAILLDNTTGCFLDQPGDKAATDARRAALLEFVRSGKGIMGIHATTDSYHSPCPNDQPAANAGGRQGGGRGRFTPGGQLATMIVSQADKDGDRKITLAELTTMANDWFDKLDTEKSNSVPQASFAARYASLSARPAGAPAQARSAQPLPAAGTWPEWNRLIGGYFKFHWVDPQLITVKIDDPKSPLTAMFDGKEFEIHDETYTFAQDSFSRSNVHVLTSIDYDKMSPEDKAKEPAATARTDHDFALSYIRREGKGRVFYEAHGHSERIYAMPAMLQHYLAGMQYVMGDLKADDSPSASAKTNQ
jgi:type 1 glutamine amidotransferase